MAIRVTVWNEGDMSRSMKRSGGCIPRASTAIANHLLTQGMKVRAATLDEPEHGLTDEVLADTDVLIWWAHIAHHEVSDEVVDKVYQRVLDGMGLIVLHSGHFSKIFRKLMGTTCDLKWRGDRGERKALGG